MVIMNSDLDRMKEEAVKAFFMVLSQNLP